jgi:hypothetical protein
VRHPYRSRTPLRPCTCHPGLCPAASRPRAGHPYPRHVACRLPELHLAAARRRSIFHATSCLPMFHASPLCSAAALPTPCWPARAPSTSLSFCPSAAAIATHVTETPAPISARGYLLLDPERSLKLLALLLSRLHTHNSPDPSCSDHLPLPDHRRRPCSPSAASTTASPFQFEAQTASPRTTEAHGANQLHVLPPESPDRSTGEPLYTAAARPPVDPPIQAFSVPINNTSSTTSTS